MKKETVTSYMVREHGKIFDLISSFRTAVEEDVKRAERDFDKFREKEFFHMYSEEIAVFKFSNKIKKFFSCHNLGGLILF